MANLPHPEPSADERAFLAAVIAHPDEDTPRLMYADWLDESAANLSGRDPTEVRARAEFIRGQIEASRFPPGDPNAKELRARVMLLARRYWGEWNEGSSVAFVRGFPMGVQFDYLDEIWGEMAPLFSRCPIQVIYADGGFGEDTEAQIVSCPHFARVTGLGSTSRGWGGRCVAKLLTNPHLTNLRYLDMNCGDYNRTAGARGIAAATHLTKLLVLDLSHT